ncbi:DEAD/DEAH box helicase [Limnohabitans sp.]|uniref:DEAD/DEAH box helicase n=1 Tax=Limnohabitans sp. TaxID=1907725 RepID=UPI00286F0F2E|nr:DEAD/DEAH box helicase [Limnohabitans sp.]
MNFSDLGLAPALQTALADMGLANPTPVQREAIPHVLQGRDVLAQAQTGSGKTLTYVLPLLQQLMATAASRDAAADSAHAKTKRITQVLVLVPTRELATQVSDVLRDLARPLAQSIKVGTVFGGVSINPQMMSLRSGADVVVATPGRLLDLVDHNALNLGHVQHLVLDEADRLLDLGFAEELQRVLALLPAQRQNLLFSATFVPAVQTLAEALLHDPTRITIAHTQEHTPDIAQRAIQVDEKSRTALLRHLIKTHAWKRVLVFVATRYACEHVANKLYKAGVFATAFHGEMSQGARQDVLAEFKEERWEVVVTTDLAARGIDIAQLPVVVNYDLPRSVTDYTHRIGRTGRAGAHGEAVSFVTAATLAHWQLIQKRAQVQLPVEVLEGFEPTEVPPPVSPLNDGTGGIKGKRPSKKDKLRAAAAATQVSQQEPSSEEASKR